jgi:WD40 repeat protein
VLSVAFSPDGKRVVSGSEDKTIRIWDAQTGHPVLEPLEGHTDLVLSVAFSPDGKRVVSGSGSDDKTIRIWDAQTGHPVLEPLKTTSFIPTISPTFSRLKVETDDKVNKSLVSNIPSIVHGWIQSPKAELICWVAPTNRVQLTLCPAALLVIGHQWNKVDLTQFMHGPSWHECKG